MEKLATIVDEQIAKLESRGMTIGDKDKAKECLLDIGYFRLGFYWFPFEKSYPRKLNRSHEFREGTCFDYAIRLYYFDYNLRNILLKYINRVEINFRTKLIYHASNRYKQAPFWYQDSKYVNITKEPSLCYMTAAVMGTGFTINRYSFIKGITTTDAVS